MRTVRRNVWRKINVKLFETRFIPNNARLYLRKRQTFSVVRGAQKNNTKIDIFLSFEAEIYEICLGVFRSLLLYRNTLTHHLAKMQCTKSIKKK